MTSRTEAPPANPLGERVVCRVTHPTDAVSVQYEARAFAERAGFSRRIATEVAIVVSELTSNVLKYGGGGTVALEHVEDPARGRGVRVVAYDEGPPFTDFDQALSDHSDENGPISASRYALRRGLGKGLGAVHRLSDACGWTPEGQGKNVWAVRWLSRR